MTPELLISFFFFLILLHKGLSWYKIPFFVPVYQMEFWGKMKTQVIPFNQVYISDGKE